MTLSGDSDSRPVTSPGVGQHGGPSEAAREAAQKAAFPALARESRDARRNANARADAALKAAHDPRLGDQRSVCLADVLKFIRKHDYGVGLDGALIAALADKVAREFGAGGGSE